MKEKDKEVVLNCVYPEGLDPSKEYKIDKESSHDLDYCPLTGYPSKDYPFLKRKIYDMDKTYHLPNIDTTMFEFFMSCIGKENLDDVFIEYLDEKITYREFIKSVYKVMASLKSYGLKKGDLVAACMPNTPEVRALIYACSYLGIRIFPIDPRTNPEALKKITEDANLLIIYEDLYPKYKDIITSKKMVVAGAIECFPKLRLVKEAYKLYRHHEKLPEKVKIEKNKNVTDWKSFISRGRQISPNDIKREYESGKTCVIESTSGTTGIPRGVELSNININYIANQHFQMGLDHHPGDTVLDLLLPSIAYWLGSFNALACMRAKTYVMPALVIEEFPKVLKKLKPNHLVLGPVHLEQLVKHDELIENLERALYSTDTREELEKIVSSHNLLGIKKELEALVCEKDDITLERNLMSLIADADLGNLSFIKHIMSGGDVISPKLYEDIARVLHKHGCYAPLLNGYGLTESCGIAGMNPDSGRNKDEVVWFPLPGNEIAIFQKGTFKECQFGEEGELCLKKNPYSSIMTGYKDDPEKTKSSLKRHDDGSIWLHTNDNAFIDSDGFVHNLGRYSDTIFKAGFKISPPTVEEAILRHPMISECRVIGIEDPKYRNIPAAFIVVKDNSVDKETLIKEIKELCAKYLTYDYFTPDIFEIIPDMPRNNSGKPDVKSLKRILNDRHNVTNK